MSIRTRKLLMASVVTFGLSSPAFAGDVAQQITEARQETQIWTTYALSPHLRGNELSVKVANGKATLTGNVEESVSKDLAKQIALGVRGVNTVDNQIVVKADYVPPARKSTDRSYGELIGDATISAAIKSKLLWSSNVEGLETGVEVNSGKVVLSGTAGSGASKDLAGRLALNTRGVNAVDNQLVVRAAKPTLGETAAASAREVGNEVSDSWITTKVKSTYLYSSNVDGSDITVATNTGVVTLSGKVDSGAERELAIELAKNIRGVKSVQSKGLMI